MLEERSLVMTSLNIKHLSQFLLQEKTVKFLYQTCQENRFIRCKSTNAKLKLRLPTYKKIIENILICYSTHPSTTNYICDQYETSKPMSTYLVAFSVSEFKNGTSQRINVYTHYDYIDQVAYITEKSNSLLSFMESYTNIPYPYAKTDLLAIPDFSSGAMENWGMNTYR